MKKLTALATALTLCLSGMTAVSGSISAQGITDVSASIEKDYHYVRYTFKELLNMSDAEFISLDTYIGDIPEENQGYFIMHRCIYEILRGSGQVIGDVYNGEFPHTEKTSWDIGTEKTLFRYNGSSDKDYQELMTVLYKLNNGSVFDENDRLLALMPLDNHSGESSEEGAIYMAISSLRSAFFLPYYDEEYKNFDRSAFESQMKAVFGDEVKYKISDYTPGNQKSLFVEFDVPECREITQENVLYFAKLYYGLTSICPYFTYSKDYYVSVSESENQLWEKFLKYDLCISDYDALTDEQKELAKFIFDTETNSKETIICERARRILKDENVGERITLEQLDGIGGIIDPTYNPHARIATNYITAVPDIKHLDETEHHEYNEYWIDENGDEKILYSVWEKDFTYCKSDGTKTSIAADFTVIRDEVFSGIFGYYVTPDDSAVITDIKSSSEEVTVPSEIDGHKVVTVLVSEINEKVKKLSVPSTLTGFGFTFKQGTELEIEAPDTDFNDNGRWYIVDEELEKITINAKNTVPLSHSRHLKEVTLKNVKEIAPFTFKGCKEFESIVIPDSAETIGEGAFLNTAIKEITIPANVKLIGKYAEKTGYVVYDIGSNSDDGRRYPLLDGADCAFNPDCVIKGYKGTEAERYAQEWNLKFVALDDEIKPVRVGEKNADGYIMGDADNSGDITIMDAVNVMAYSINPYKYPLSKLGKQLADVYNTGDGVNNMDALEIMKYLAGILETEEKTPVSFGLTPSKTGVDEFIAEYNPNKSGEWYNVTPEEITDKYGFKVFKNDKSCRSILEYKGNFYELGEYFGGFGTISFAVADLNNDGYDELYFTYSWGSGINHEDIGCFDTKNLESGNIYGVYYDNDIFIDTSNGKLEVYTAEFQKGWNYVNISCNPKEKIGEISAENGVIRFIETEKN